MLHELLFHISHGYALPNAEQNSATTQNDYSQIRASLKEIERDCGDSRYLRNQHIVKMDIDVLLFGKQKMHEKDWERPYIKQLMSILSK